MNGTTKIQDKGYEVYENFCKLHFPSIKLTTPHSRTAEIIGLLSEGDGTDEDLLAIILDTVLSNFEIPKLKVVEGELFRVYEGEERYFQ